MITGPRDPSSHGLSPKLDSSVLSLSAEGIASKLVDGYIAGGSVGIDTDGDGILSADEILTTTDANGNFTLPAD